MRYQACVKKTNNESMKCMVYGWHIGTYQDDTFALNDKIIISRTLNCFRTDKKYQAQNVHRCSCIVCSVRATIKRISVYQIIIQISEHFSVFLLI